MWGRSLISSCWPLDSKEGKKRKELCYTHAVSIHRSGTRILNIFLQVFLQIRLSQRNLVCDFSTSMVKAQDQSLLYSLRFDKINYNALFFKYLSKERESEQESKFSVSKAKHFKLNYIEGNAIEIQEDITEFRNLPSIKRVCLCSLF